MKTLKQLKEERADKLAEINAIDDLARTENRSLTAEEKTNWDARNAELDELDEDIAREERRLKLARQTAQPAATAGGNPVADGEGKEKRQMAKRFNFGKMLTAQMNNRSFTGVEKELHEIGEQELRGHKQTVEGFALPEFMVGKPNEARAHSAGSAASMGNTIDTTLEIIPAIYPKTPLFDMGVTVLSGLRGNFDLIDQDDEATSTWEGETDENAEVTIQTSKRTMSPKRLGAFVTTSKQLILQSEIPDVGADLQMQLGKAEGVALETAMINGSGTAPVPRGLLNYTGLQTVALGTDGGAMTFAKLVELETKLKRYNMGRVALITTHELRGAMKTTPKESGQAIYLASNNEANGYPLFVTEQMPNNLTKGAGTALNAAIFGDWSSWYIGYWGGRDIVVDPYTLAKNNQVRIIMNAFADCAPKYLKSFVAIVDATV